MGLECGVRVAEAKALGIGRIVIAGNVQRRERGEQACLEIGANIETTAFVEAAFGGEWLQGIPVVDDACPAAEFLACLAARPKRLGKLCVVQLPKTFEFVELLDSVLMEER